MTTCPYCNGPLEDWVKTCPFCNKPLPVFAPVQKTEKKPKWFHNTTSLVIGFFVVGPFVLPAVWSHPHYSQRKKIILTIVILVLTLLIVVPTIGAFQQYWKIYDDILNGTY